MASLRALQTYGEPVLLQLLDGPLPRHPRIMMARLGHANSRITMELYAHARADDQVTVAVAVDEALRSARPITVLSRATASR